MTSWMNTLTSLRVVTFGEKGKRRVTDVEMLGDNTLVGVGNLTVGEYYEHCFLPVTTHGLLESLCVPTSRPPAPRAHCAPKCGGVWKHIECSLVEVNVSSSVRGFTISYKEVSPQRSQLNINYWNLTAYNSTFWSVNYTAGSANYTHSFEANAVYKLFAVVVESHWMHDSGSGLRNVSYVRSCAGPPDVSPGNVTVNVGHGLVSVAWRGLDRVEDVWKFGRPEDGTYNVITGYISLKQTPKPGAVVSTLSILDQLWSFEAK